jgi:hypothetical protein
MSRLLLVLFLASFLAAVHPEMAAACPDSSCLGAEWLLFTPPGPAIRNQ